MPGTADKQYSPSSDTARLAGASCLPTRRVPVPAPAERSSNARLTVATDGFEKVRACGTVIYARRCRTTHSVSFRNHSQDTGRGTLGLSPHVVRALAVEAMVCTPTVLRVLRGKPTQPSGRARVLAALTKIVGPAPEEEPRP